MGLFDLRLVAVSLAVVVGCGRIDFDLRPADAGMDADEPSDASDASDAHVVTLPPEPPEVVAELEVGVPASTAGSVSATALDVDTGGNVVVAGWFEGEVDFGGGARVAKGRDVFVSRYSSDGTYRWDHTFGADPNDAAADVAFDDAGNIYVVGLTSGDVQFVGALREGLGGSDIFIASYTTTGTERFTRLFGGANEDRATSVAILGTTLIVGGVIGQGADLGGGARTIDGRTSGVLARYERANGAYRGERLLGASVDALAVSDSQVFAAGALVPGSTIDGRPRDTGGAADAFVVGLDESLALSWDDMDLLSRGGVLQMASRDGAICEVGTVRDWIEIDGERTELGESSSAFVSCRTTAGNPTFHRTFVAESSGTGGARAEGIAIDEAGRVLVVGTATGAIDLGGGLHQADTRNAFIVALDDGDYAWEAMYGAESEAIAADIFADGGDLSFAGHYGPDIDFGDGEIQAMGRVDAYVTRIRP